MGGLFSDRVSTQGGIRACVPDAWRPVVDIPELDGAWTGVERMLAEEHANGHRVFPPEGQYFSALDWVSPADVRVVIVGQDPYIQEGQANGLAFSVAEGVCLPPSLRNIFAEVAAEYGGDLPQGGDLGRWASQGVLLINSVLTVREGASASHAGRGWEAITDRILSYVASHAAGVVFMLWGRHAQAKRRLVGPCIQSGEEYGRCDAGGRRLPLLLETSHPSPLSARRGFMGCGHFREANAYLRACGQEEVVW